jgi:hypothetical protein
MSSAHYSGVGTVDAFNGEYSMVLHDQALPDIKSADRFGQGPSESDVRPFTAVRFSPGEYSLGSEKFRQKNSRRPDEYPFGFQFICKRPQKRVILLIS